MPELVSAPGSPLMNGEQLFSFSTLAKKLPGHRSNTHLNAATIFRWATRGVRTSAGVVVRLEAIRLGSSWKSSLEAVSRFTEKLTSASLPSGAHPAQPAATPKQRSRDAARAKSRADEIFGDSQ